MVVLLFTIAFVLNFLAQKRGLHTLVTFLQDEEPKFIFLTLDPDTVLVPFSCSLDSKFLVSSSTDGSARIWNIDEGSPLTNLTRASVQYDILL